jgi:hypothetical protein
MKKQLSFLLLSALLIVAPMPLSGAEKLPVDLGKMFEVGVIKLAANQTSTVRSHREPLLLAQTEIPVAPPVAGEVSAPSEHVVISSVPIELFACVEYEDLRNIHPCAVTKIVAVQDPGEKPCKRGWFGSSCGKCDQCCDTCNKCESTCDSCCEPEPVCVYIQICVPPESCDCKCPEIKVSRKGSKIKYDYGDYEVEITSKDGVVKVDYDD